MMQILFECYSYVWTFFSRFGKTRTAYRLKILFTINDAVNYYLQLIALSK